MNKQWSGKVGDVITLSKSVSEADMALFGLINRDDAFVPEDPRNVPSPRWIGSERFLAYAEGAAHRFIRWPGFSMAPCPR